MKSNSQMKAFIKEYQINTDQIGCLSKDLEAILSEGIIEKDDSFFLKALVSEESNIQEALIDHIDRTGVECFFNHLHIEDFLKKKRVLPKELLQQSFCYANKLDQVLGKSNSFEIIISFSTDPIYDCNVRFHLLRDGEDWLLDDLESYEDAISII